LGVLVGVRVGVGSILAEFVVEVTSPFVAIVGVVVEIVSPFVAIVGVVIEIVAPFVAVIGVTIGVVSLLVIKVGGVVVVVALVRAGGVSLLASFAGDFVGVLDVFGVVRVEMGPGRFTTQTAQGQWPST
jgi:hypothetical protein